MVEVFVVLINESDVLPVSTNWDDLLGTRLTRHQASKRFARLASGNPTLLAPKPTNAVDCDTLSISSSSPSTHTTALPPSPASSDVEIGGLRDRTAIKSKQSVSPADIAPNRPIHPPVVLSGPKIE